MTRRLSFAILAGGLALLLIGAGLVLYGTRDRGIPPPPGVAYPNVTPAAIVDRLPAPPSIAPPANLDGVPATRIRVPERAIDLTVVAGDGVNAPLYKAAEYPSPMKLPGQGARSMIYAHARAGMFGPLLNARVGDHVEVTLADGRQLHYVVREYYAHWPVNDLRWFSQATHEQLLLVTCTTYDPNDPRIVLVAEPT